LEGLAMLYRQKYHDKTHTEIVSRWIGLLDWLVRLPTAHALGRRDHPLKERDLSNLYLQRAVWLMGLNREGAVQQFLHDSRQNPDALHPAVCNTFLRILREETLRFMNTGMTQPEQYCAKVMLRYLKL